MRGEVVVGVLLLAIALFSSVASATTYNVTTDASGFVLISAPESTGADVPFPVDVSYYFLNMLVQSVNVSIVKDGTVIYAQSFNSSTENTTAHAVLQEQQNAVYSYAVRLSEAMEGKSVLTEIPFSVKVTPKIFAFENMTIWRGLSLNASETAFEDLAEYEPESLQGAVKYSVMQKLANQVDCDAQGSTIIFLPAEGFSGPAECVVKGTAGNTTVRFQFKFLVASPADAVRFGREHGTVVHAKAQMRNLEARALTVTAADEFTIATNLAIITVSVLPEDITEGMNGRIRVEAQVVDPTIVERIDTVGILINDLNISNNTCGNESCSVSYDLTYARPGLLPFFTFANLITRKEVGLNTTLPSGWSAVSSSANDLFIASQETHAFVRPHVPDLNAPYVGVVTDPADKEEKAAVDTLLREYQKKTREGVKMEEEYERIRKVAESVFVEKSLERVVRVESDGTRSTHTIYYVRLVPKDPTLTDYVLGFRHVKNVMVIEHIAKEAASNLGHVRFEDKGYEIIADDPVVVWRIGELRLPTEFSYEVDRPTDKAGNTLVFGDVERGFPNVVFVVLVPLIIVALIVFDRFRKRPNEEILDLKDKPPTYDEIQKDYIVREAPSAAQPGKVESLNTIGEFDQLIDGVEDYIARRLAKGDHREHIKQELVKMNWPDDIVEKLVQKRERMRDR